MEAESDEEYNNNNEDNKLTIDIFSGNVVNLSTSLFSNKKQNDMFGNGQINKKLKTSNLDVVMRK